MSLMRLSFSLGRIVSTPGALEDFGPVLIAELLSRHASGDWGDLDAHDRRENERAIRRLQDLLRLRHSFRESMGDHGSVALLDMRP
jgi:hypothetical protein